MIRITELTLLSAVALIPPAVMIAGDRPVKPLRLLDIVEQLQDDNYGPFSEVSFDDGDWEVEVRYEDVAYELLVDAKTGQILSRHRDDPDLQPPADALPLSEVLKRIAQTDGYSEIDEVSFERRYWEIEAFKDRQKYEIHVDPLTGKIISERIDD